MTFFYAPATDTQELPAVLRGTEPPTVELSVLDLRPELPRCRRRRFVTRDDFAAAWRESVVGRGVATGLLALAFLAVVLHGGHVLYLASIGAAR